MLDLSAIEFKEKETDLGTSIQAVLKIFAAQDIPRGVPNHQGAIAHAKEGLSINITQQLYSELRETSFELIELLRKMNPDPRYPMKAENLVRIEKIEQKLKTLLW